MQFQKVHPLDPQESIIDSTGDKAKASRDNTEIQDYRKALNNSDQVSRQDIKRSSNIKCLQDMLMESQSDTPTSDDSFDDNDSADGDSEVILHKQHINQELETVTKVTKTSIMNAHFAICPIYQKIYSMTPILLFLNQAYADETQSSMEAARIKADQGRMEISDQFGP